MRNAPRNSRRSYAILRGATLLVCLGAALWSVEQRLTDPLVYIALAAFALGVILISLEPRRRRPILDRRAARDAAAGRVRRLRQVFVIDGDTVDNVRSRIRYRLQNIDAPETGDNAECETERRLGERAKWDAIALVRSAATIEARPTGEIDQYGRTLAYILIDGRDLGDA